jgi:hypothetical protein
MSLVGVVACATLGLVGAVAAAESPPQGTVIISRPVFAAAPAVLPAVGGPAAGAAPALSPKPGVGGGGQKPSAETLATPRPVSAAPEPTASPGELHPASGTAPLAPVTPAFVDPRTYAWQQRRIPPPDMPGVDAACELGLVLADGRCFRERVIDYVLHWPCPGRCAQRKCAVAMPP